MSAPPEGRVQARIKRLRRSCRPAPFPQALRADRLQALYQEPAHYLSAGAQTERGEACGRHSGRARPLRRARPAPRGLRTELGGCPAPLSPLLCAGLWRCLRRCARFICSLAVVALPSSSVCLSSSSRLCVQFGFVLLPRAYSRGLRPHPLALSASCRARVRAASGHAAIAALRHSGWVIICRLPRCAAAAPPRGFPPVQLPGVCPRGGPSDCPTDSDLIYRLPHRQITI